ncbi:MAG: hypothetical protein A3F73_03750 [Gallionellales bacterium RIFCSPLOWO2_12_FULL_59_22]|nr:MAG: hypothetical protein A3H99_01070 [Gallionellales bacterium RIFCSPLOWO2_02_FULL_59_110]OGT01423.1 MAG: hypothetical protein A2Z65_13720 [Gallionellales bacterium RIFCSPLOWO2_02_58_13]OGT14498.1 MAG: hypothetical protein A3F73_03750 [Gallionellales bacterium RIFCSPLOWO2_12_FULL_59_22]
MHIQEYQIRMTDSFRTIVSVHLPKTAGTTFLHLLRGSLGNGSVLPDYMDDPCDPNSPRNLDPAGYFARQPGLPDGCLAVHGHFHIQKYANIRNPFRVTFLRHPVDTLHSIYSYWKTLGPGRHALHDYFLSRRLDIFETARLPLLRYILTRNYFEAVDMKSFHFIGRFESFSTDLSRLSDVLGIPLSSDIHLNKHEKSAGLNEAAPLDPAERARLRDILIDDVNFYESTTGADQ